MSCGFVLAAVVFERKKKIFVPLSDKLGIYS
jgi:hypothetical protein